MLKRNHTNIIILFVLTLVTASCNSNGNKTVKNDINEDASVIELSIGGMSCTGCEQTIQRNIGKLEGIKSVKASFTTGNAIVEYYPSTADTSEIKEAVTGSGYIFNKFIPVEQETNTK